MHTPGVINPKEVDELLFTDDVQEAFDYIVRSLEAGPLRGRAQVGTPRRDVRNVRRWSVRRCTRSAVMRAV